MKTSAAEIEKKVKMLNCVKNGMQEYSGNISFLSWIVYI